MISPVKPLFCGFIPLSYPFRTQVIAVPGTVWLLSRGDDLLAMGFWKEAMLIGQKCSETDGLSNIHI